jgi:cell volume regulation protein A
VLEGSLELELDKSKLPLLKKSIWAALLPLVVLSLILATAFWYFYPGYSFKVYLANAIPLGVISSAIAIPTAKNMNTHDREFITYESSLSDILGVIFFNFVVFNEVFGFLTFANFFVQIFIIFIISFISTIGLSFLLRKIEHHIKFAPIIVLIILIYTISKEYHLPALVFILIFGLFLGNLEKIKQFGWMERMRPEILAREVDKFNANLQSLAWAAGITLVIFLVRYISLKVLRVKMFPLLSIAPRGLITILLFLTIPQAQQIPIVNRSMILQVVIITSLVMMTGTVSRKKPEIINPPENT